MLLSETQAEKAKDALAAFAEKAAKLRVPAPQLEATGLSVEEVLILQGEHLAWVPASEVPSGAWEAARRYRAEYRLVEADLRLGGWRLEATIDLVSAAEPLTWRAPSGMEVPASILDDPSRCEHCDARRKRRETFVLRHDDGRWIKVGRTCLKDFLGHDVAGKLTRVTALLKEAQAATTAATGGGRSRELCPPSRWSLEAVLVCTSRAIERHGWVSGKDAWQSEGRLAPTKDRVAELLADDGAIAEAATPEARARAAEIADWMADRPTDASTYIRNLGVLGRERMVSASGLGTAVSAVVAYEQATTKKLVESRGARELTHVAEPDEEFQAVVQVVRTQKVGTRIGARTLVVLRPVSGECYDLTWWLEEDANIPKILKREPVVRISAVVLNTSYVFQGTPQTAIGHVAIDYSWHEARQEAQRQ